jgi:AbrB family looped-hinge helix DNA binding protein
MSTHEVVVRRSGEVTIPAKIRHALGIKLGDRLLVRRVGDTIRLTHALSIVERTAGCLSKNLAGPPRTIEKEGEAFERAVAEEVIASMNW